MSGQISIPSAGDILICTSGQLVGNIAYLSGIRGNQESSFQACFNARPFYDGESISCSGGMRVNINADSLFPTGKLATVHFEMCPLGYNGFPNGEVKEESVTIWEYRDPTPSVFKGIFSVEDVLNRMRADYVFEVRQSPSPLAKHFNGSDRTGRAIFNAAKNFEAITWVFYPQGNEFGERYTMQIGINKLGGFKTQLEFEQFIKAYHLELNTVEEHTGYLIPSMNVEEWAPVGWRKRKNLSD